ncbi:ROK family transcriptional regulator [bacterium]|nr:MAG: ROK family transcriptional regulator [bacterium]
MDLLSRVRNNETLQEGRLLRDRSITVGTPSLLRAINERTVLDVIHRQGPLSRAQVARVCGLSKPTVSLALTGLLDAGLVREVGRSRGERGPSALLYELNPAAGWVVGLDVGRVWVRAAIADIAGNIVARRDERAKVGSAKALIGQVGGIARRLAGEAGVQWSQVTHAVLGSPGVFDPTHGHVAMAPNLPGWGRHGLVEAVREELGTNVNFENDVNLAALAERAHGHGRNVDNFVLLSVGTGIGMALVIDGQLYRGAHGAAGEVAYMPLGMGDPRDPANRRRGAFEEAAAAAGVVRIARQYGMRMPLSPERIFTAARRGHAVASRVVEAEASRLALAIATVAPVLDPELVILGGGIGRNGDLLLEPIERELRQLLPFRPRVAVSALGEDAVLRGAVAIALEVARERVFSRAPGRQVQEVAG